MGAGDEGGTEYVKAREALKKEFNFKHWTAKKKGEHEFCNNKLPACENGAWKLQQEEYMKKINPMSTTSKKQHDELTSSLSGLLGAMQWTASISFLCKHVSGATNPSQKQQTKHFDLAKETQMT